MGAALELHLAAAFGQPGAAFRSCAGSGCQISATELCLRGSWNEPLPAAANYARATSQLRSRHKITGRCKNLTLKVKFFIKIIRNLTKIVKFPYKIPRKFDLKSQISSPQPLHFKPGKSYSQNLKNSQNFSIIYIESEGRKKTLNSFLVQKIRTENLKSF